MIIKELIRQQWLKALRSPGYYQNLAVNLLVGFMILYMASIIIVLGAMLRNVFVQTLPEYYPEEAFYGTILYLIMGELSMRFVLQQLNTLNLPPYQVLPIKRNSLVNYLLLKPMFNPINYLVLLLVIPFAVRCTLADDISVLTGFAIVVLMVFVVWFDILSASFLKRRFGSSIAGLAIVAGLIGAIAAAEYFKLFSLFSVSLSIFSFIFDNPAALILCFVPVIGAYALNKWFFSSNYYPERFNQKAEGKRVNVTDFSFMRRFGVIGELITLQVKLILRHKRTKSMLYFSVIFLFYGLLFYPNYSLSNNQGLVFFIAMFMTGIFMLMFGQWIVSWNGTHFDCIMTQKISARTYLQANYVFLVSTCVVSFVVTMPYFLYGKYIVVIHLVGFVYNLGVNTVLFLLVAPFNAKRLELSKGSAMNYQGTTYKSFIYVLPMLLFPLILVSICSACGVINVAFIILSGMGVLGLVFRRPALNMCERLLLKRKYALLEGFRKKD